jgi:PAS domain S-box-containing protein
MKSQLRILYLEDDPRDAELIQEALAVDGITCHATRVETEADFIASLEQGDFDLILADYTLPSFDGLSALKIAQQGRPHVPFIFVSGTLGEEVAIEALKVGATDYVFKTRLSRIAPAVRRALRESEKRIELSQSEKALRRSEAYLTEAQKLSRTGSFSWDVSSGEIYWSRETFRIFEYAPTAKITIELILQRTHPEDRSAVQHFIDRASRERAEFDFEHRLLMPDGSVKYVRVVGQPSKDESGSFEFVGAVTDITDRKQADEKLRRSEAYLAEAQRLAHTGSWAWNVRTGDTFWSEEMFRIVGYDPEKTKPTLSRFLERVHPEDRPQTEHKMRMESTGLEKADSEAEYRIVFEDGTIRYLHSVARAVVNESGEVTEVIGTTMDVTERKRAEEEHERLRQAQADLARVTRVTTMAELTASLAHEVNQPITAAITDSNTCLRWLARDPPDVEEAREAASRIVKDATRAAAIINRIRILFKKGTPQPQPVDVNEVIREMIALLRNEADRYAVSIRTDLTADLPKVTADRVQLQQVLMNLMLNGIEAMKDISAAGELTIKTQRADSGHLLISVSDAGVGLAPQEADQIFNALSATKPEGAGMGLPISRSFIESHGGRLWASANSGRGTTFHFTLPSEVKRPK